MVILTILQVVGTFYNIVELEIGPFVGMFAGAMIFFLYKGKMWAKVLFLMSCGYNLYNYWIMFRAANMLGYGSGVKIMVALMTIPSLVWVYALLLSPSVKAFLEEQSLS